MTSLIALKMATMWYMVGIIPELRLMSFQELKAMLDECGELSLREPLHQIHESKFLVKNFDIYIKCTGVYVIALIVAGLWIACGEKEEMTSSLCETWPIKDALMLVEPRTHRLHVSQLMQTTADLEQAAKTEADQSRFTEMINRVNSFISLIDGEKL